jgi:hypothetical protein
MIADWLADLGACGARTSASLRRVSEIRAKEEGMEFLISRDEVLSVRTASRSLYAVLQRLERGDAEKYVLLDRKNDLRAVLLTTDEYAALLADAGRVRQARSKAA